MYFNVDAVPAERFAQWVAATRTTGPALDPQTYADLAKPSQRITPFSYRAVAPDLFKGIVSSMSTPEHASRFVSPTSQRAEK
jgi:cytochrome o ubiquinol oxidase subunit 2